jgi:phosphopantetheinyl transferase
MKKGYVVHLMDVKAFENEETFESCLSLVSEYRRNKVNRLRGHRDKVSSLAAGVLLSYCLKKYANIDETTVKFSVTKAGKPSIVDDEDTQYRLDDTSFGGDAFCASKYSCGESDIQFSISHTDKYVAVIVADRPCGVDVEAVRSFPDSIVKRIFSDKDIEIIRQKREVDESGSTGADMYSIKVWTRREAYSKMTGSGILMQDRLQKKVMEDDYMSESGVTLWNLQNQRDKNTAWNNKSKDFTYCLAVCVQGRAEKLQEIEALDSRQVAEEFCADRS